MAAILKLCRQTENPTLSVDAYLLEHSCPISPRSGLKRRSLRLFEEVAPAGTTSRRMRRNKMSSHIISVSDLKISNPTSANKVNENILKPNSSEIRFLFYEMFAASILSYHLTFIVMATEIYCRIIRISHAYMDYRNNVEILSA